MNQQSKYSNAIMSNYENEARITVTLKGQLQIMQL